MLALLLGLPKQSEILIIIFLGICFLSLDFSLFEIHANLETVWKLELKNAKCFETVLKYIISAVVLARTFTLHAFLACYVVMLWPAINEEKPNLMLPWLLLGIIRCLFLNLVTFVVGTFICYKERGCGPICLEYILAQIIEHGPSVYAWFSVLSFYRDLAGEYDSNQSEDISLLSGTQRSIDSRNSEEKEDDWDKSKSYSLSDLNLDYMHSSRYKRPCGDMPLELLIVELRHLVSKTRIMQDSSKSCNSLRQDKSDEVDVFETLSKTDLTVIEKTMKILEISDQDVANAQQDKNKIIKILREVKKEDVNLIDEDLLSKITSPGFYIRQGHILKTTKTNLPKSLSLHEDAKSRKSCMCSLRRKLQKEQLDVSIVENEIANIKFDETDNDDDPTTKEGKSKCSKERCKLNSGSKNCEAKPEIKFCEPEPVASYKDKDGIGGSQGGTSNSSALRKTSRGATSKLKREEAKFELKKCGAEPVGNYYINSQEGNSAESDEESCGTKSKTKHGEAKFEIKECEAESVANYNEISKSQEGTNDCSTESDKNGCEAISESKRGEPEFNIKNVVAEPIVNYNDKNKLRGSPKGNSDCGAESDDKNCKAISESRSCIAKSETRIYKPANVTNYTVNEETGDSQRENTNYSAQSECKSCEAKSESKCVETKSKSKRQSKCCVTRWKSFGEAFSTNYIQNNIPYALSQYRVVLGASLGFTKINVFKKFSVKKNMARNFVCQVSWLGGFRNELAKQLICLRNC